MSKRQKSLTVKTLKTYPAALFNNPWSKVLLKVLHGHVLNADCKFRASASMFNGCSAQLEHGCNLLQSRFTMNSVTDNTLESVVTVSGSTQHLPSNCTQVKTLHTTVTVQPTITFTITMRYN